MNETSLSPPKISETMTKNEQIERIIGSYNPKGETSKIKEQKACVEKQIEVER